MSDLALVRSEKAARFRGHNLNARRYNWPELSGRIWGEHYAGTIPTYRALTEASMTPLSESSMSGHARAFDLGSPTQLTVSLDAQVARDWNHTLGATEIGMSVWGGDCVLALPSYSVPPVVNLLLSTTGLLEGTPGSVVVLDEEETRTEPSDFENVPAWRRIFNTYERGIAGEPTAGGSLVITPTRDPHLELRQLVETTRLPAERLGQMLGASRRTIYNWLSNRPIRDDAQARIFRLHDSLSPVAATRDPLLVREWLLRGDPPPAELAADEQWTHLQDLVSSQAGSIQPVEGEATPLAGEPHAESSNVLRAVLLAFGTRSAGPGNKRPDWRPREVTGISAEYEEDAE
jgi:hypothetical protein